MLKSIDLFSGIGGIAHALRGLGIEPVAYCERDPWAIAVLRQRMRCGDLPPATIHTDVESFPGKQYKGKVHVLAGGFPCFPAGTPVLTNKGYKPIETVSHDDLLLTHTGSWKPIENTQRKVYPGRMASVSTEFQTIKCTDNHPFYARTVTNNTPEWVAARDLTSDHYVGIPVGHAKSSTAAYIRHIDNGYAWYAITDVVTYQPDEPLCVYNFQVQDDHSYVVHHVVVKNCTGLSSMKMAQRDGFNNAGTGLFRDVIRLVEEIQPNIVFLENVAVIRLHGLKFVAETLRSRGYDVSWVSLRGFNVGAPQHRPRWFCLATRTGVKLPTLTLKSVFKKYNWLKEPCPRMVLDKTMTNERNALLGNSVIPDLVRWAFLYLWTGSRLQAPAVLTSKSWPFAVPDKSTAIPVDMNEYPTAFGMAFGTNMTATLPTPIGLLDLPKSRQRIMDPSKFTFTGPKSANNTLEPYTKPTPITTWATPRHSNLIPSRVLTRRTILDLPTQVRFAQDTPDALRPGHPNPEFLEWLMGFPRGWTDPFGKIR